MTATRTPFMLRIAGNGAASTGAFRLPEDGSSIPIEDLWSGSRATTDPAFCAFLSTLAVAARQGQIRLDFPPFEPPALSPPGSWNLVGDRGFADEHPDAWDYLSPSSPNFALKRFERRLYVRHLEEAFRAIPSGAPVLDLGGGIGRFAVEWLERGHPVTLVDANPQALSLALGHLARVGGQFGIAHLAAEHLAGIPDESVFAVTAMEVLCYLSEPHRGVQEAVRVLRPGGLFIASVETPMGSLPLGERHSREAIAAAQERTETAAENDVWVQYFTDRGLHDLCEDAGLQVERVIGTHYLTDGPMHHLVDVERLGDENYELALIELEQILAASARWKNAARAWLVVARKPLR